MNMRNFINVILLGILIFFGVDKFSNFNLIDKFYLTNNRVIKESFNNEEIKIKSKKKKLALNQRFTFDKFGADYLLFLFLMGVPLIIIWSIPYSNKKK
tara:strand:- start:674 stop:967 length:294 start_codon:yes stop_codon:yes gene_type:complete